MDVVATGSLDSVRRDVDSFLLSLPLGTDRDSADVEEAVARRLISCEIERLKLQKKLHQWQDPDLTQDPIFRGDTSDRFSMM